MSKNSIVFDHVSKEFFKGPRYFPSLRDWVGLLLTGKRPKYEKFLAIRDMSFKIKKGQTVGFVGRNGAGKSTLLKLVSKVTKPTEGSITTDGNVAGLLELGAGFHPELTGRENISFKAMLLGIGRKKLDEIFDDIIEFSGLGSFIDMPVKHYSSGMYARLGFSVAIHVDPEVLLIDEVLSVGDVSFQKKCFDRIKKFCSDKERTVVFVSHNLNAVEDLCDRVIWLRNGEIVEDGKAKRVINNYKNSAEDSDEILG